MKACGDEGGSDQPTLDALPMPPDLPDTVVKLVQSRVVNVTRPIVASSPSEGATHAIVPAGTSLAGASGPATQRAGAASPDRQACIRTCVSGCNDDAACERNCVSTKCH
jgi:hypothetical protein